MLRELIDNIDTTMMGGGIFEVAYVTRVQRVWRVCSKEKSLDLCTDIKSMALYYSCYISVRNKTT